MKKLIKAVFTLSALLLMGCSNDVDTMLDNYNSNYGIEVTTKENPSPGEEGFDEKEMLSDTYCVGDHETINLAGPRNCDSWSWIVTDPSETSESYDKNNEKVTTEKAMTILFFNGTYADECKERIFATYIPESGLSPGKTYKLTLKVTDKEGQAYTDVCELVIYQHLDL